MSKTGVIQVLLDDEDSKVSFSQGSVDVALISFAGIGLGLGGLPQEEFRKSLNKKYSVYFCVDKKRNWYNCNSEKILKVVNEDLQSRGISKTYTIGNSMGGFAALCFAAKIPKCCRAIAFSPQTSICPDITPFDSRYRDFYEALDYVALPDLLPHLSNSIEYIAMAGTGCREDIEHLERINSKCLDNVRLIAFQGKSHNFLRELKNEGLDLQSFVENYIEIPFESIPKSFIEPRHKSDISSFGECFEPRGSTGIEVADVELRNLLEIQVFGLQRSGNHAVIAWLLQQSNSPVTFLNNVDHFKDPFIFFRQGVVHNMILLSRRYPNKQEALRAEKKALLVHSYENLVLRQLAVREIPHDRDRVIGKSGKVIKILLLRDFFNWAASRIKLMEFRQQDIAPVIENFNPMIDLWISYAQEFSRETRFITDRELVKISYNRWVVDCEYRAHILGSIGLPLLDNINNAVPNVGGGSSFDRTSFSGAAADMKTTERWTYLFDPRFQSVISAIISRRNDLEKYQLNLFHMKWPLLR